jgi:hypothetical protein
MKLIKIKEGQHLSNQMTGIRFLTNGVIEFDVMFDEQSRYLLGDGDQYDWNKLYGCSWGFFPLIDSFQMHYNSSRFGWRYMPDTGTYELTPYYYIKGERKFNSSIKAVLNENEVYNCTITPWYDHVIYKVIHKATGNEVLYFESEEEIVDYNGFLAPGYFGGNKKAPKNISYLFKKL